MDLPPAITCFLSMRLSGPSTDLNKLLAEMTPQRLAELGADLLAVRGHSRIKIVDGPGDGGRDIHSLDARGAPHLTQCKHHGNTAAVSSREVGDLVLGMVKLGYKRGLFLTTGRISPQSKREFLDDYPDLSLEFLEGSELGSEVLRDVLLRALWYNGVALDRVSYSISVPVLLRDLVLDKPLPLRSVRGSFTMKRHRKSAIPETDVVDVRLQSTTFRSSDFAPYRPPARKTMAEGWWPIIEGGELLFTRLERIEQLQSLLKAVANRVLARAASRYPDQSCLALRIGVPSITPLEGRQAGSRIELRRSPFTVLRYGDQVIEEFDWLVPTFGPHWYPPDNISAVTANWVRWYCPEHDLCLDLNLIGLPSDHGRGTVAEQLEYLKRQWKQSVFALVRKAAIEEMLQSGMPQPTEQLSWSEDKVLCCWLVALGSSFRSILIEPEDEAEHKSSPFELDPKEVSEASAQLRKELQSWNAEVLDPEKARHAYAYVAHDPFPSPDEVVYRSVDLLYHFDDVPSPIAPTARQIQFVVCWLLSERRSDEWYTLVQQAVERLRTTYDKVFAIKLVYDTETLSGTYVVLYIDYLPNVGLERTEYLVKTILDQLLPLLDDAEEALLTLAPNVRRATQHFWNREIGLYFPPVMQRES